MTPRTLNNQDGIALGPILFIIAILAILAAAIAAGSGEFTANTSDEQAKSNAEALVQYADQLQMAVQKVMADNSCSDTQLKFQGNNSNAPSDGSCNIFDPRGGGIVEQNFTNLAGAFDLTKAATNGGWWGSYGHFNQNYGVAVTGVGNPSNSQLMFTVYGLSLATCTAINKIVGYNVAGNYAPTVLGWYITGGYFYGTYFFNGPYGLPTQQGCVYDSNYGEYNYIGVLLAR